MVSFLHPDGCRNWEVIPELFNVVHEHFIHIGHDFCIFSDSLVEIPACWRIFTDLEGVLGR
jgi:hypothetical protein